MRTILALIMTVFLFGNMPLGNAQIPSNQSLTPKEQGRTFQSISDGFSLAVPDGWVIQDVHNADTGTLLDEIMQRSRPLALLCPQEHAFADTEGRYSCEEAYESILIQKYRNLADEAEFASNARGTISNEDLVDYQILKLQKLGYTEISILHNTKTTINVISSGTNNTTAIVPASFIEMRYNNANSTDTRGYFMLAATNATSSVGIISGYSLSYEADAAILPSGSPPEPIQKIFQSFEFVKEAREGELASQTQNNNNDHYNDAAAGTAGRPTRYPENILSPSVGLPDQTNAITSSLTSNRPNDYNNDENESENDYKTYLVGIVQGASTTSDTAYSPNPVEVKIGDTVKWINQDTLPHTASSGQPGDPESSIAADILVEGETYSITFDHPGIYPYFCILHPNMVGTAIVTET
jgi:plastocyanin